MDWAGANRKSIFARKNVVLGWVVFFSKIIALFANGAGLGNATFAGIRRKCEVEDDAGGI